MSYTAKPDQLVVAHKCACYFQSATFILAAMLFVMRRCGVTTDSFGTRFSMTILISLYASILIVYGNRTSCSLTSTVQSFVSHIIHTIQS